MTRTILLFKSIDPEVFYNLAYTKHLCDEYFNMIRRVVEPNTFNISGKEVKVIS